MVSGILIGNMSEDDFDAASKNVPEPLSGSETAEIISSLYDSAGPRVGAHLVEANSVLTFAGVRGQTEFFIKNPTSEDRESIVKANETVATKGIRIRSVGKDLNDPEGKSILMVNVGSLRGHERVSLLTKLPGVKPFNSGSGWEGFAKWNSELGRAIDTAQKDRLLPAGKEFSSDIHSGIHKVQDWLQSNINQKHTLEDLAEIAIMSSRNLTRIFKKETGITIKNYIDLLRKDKMSALLKNPNLSKIEIANQIGLKNKTQLRRLSHV